MTDLQDEALITLADVWCLSPEVRLGQLMAHLGFLGESHLDKGLGTIEDDELLAILYRHRAELQGRISDAANETALSVSGSSTLPVP